MVRIIATNIHNSLVLHNSLFVEDAFFHHKHSVLCPIAVSIRPKQSVVISKEVM